MIESIIRFLIGMCLLVAAVLLILWVLAELGILIPAFVVKIIWIIAALIAILFLVQILRPYAGNWLP